MLATQTELWNSLYPEICGEYRCYSIFVAPVFDLNDISPTRLAAKASCEFRIQRLESNACLLVIWRHSSASLDCSERRPRSAHHVFWRLTPNWWIPGLQQVSVTSVDPQIFLVKRMDILLSYRPR